MKEAKSKVNISKWELQLLVQIQILWNILSKYIHHRMGAEILQKEDKKKYNGKLKKENSDI